MKENKMNKKFLILIFVLIFILQNVSAFGITPGRTTITFEPSLEQQISFSIINSEHEDASVVFAIRGNLSEYVTLNQAYAEISSSEESKSFSYTIKLPQKIENPGKYEVEIVAMKMPKGFEETTTTIGSTVAVVTQLHVFVPYPNKYVEGKVNVIESNGELVFFVPITNYGKLDIVNVEAKIDIYDTTDEKIASITTNTDSILSLERKELSAKWDPDINPGRYKAIVTLIYDEDVTTILKEFNYGEMFLEIEEIVVRDFSLGEIAKFNALVQNKWSSNLKDVYLNTIVYNNEGEIMADFKSPNYDVEALSKEELISFWDTGGVRTGTYDGKIILRYGEKMSEKNIQLKISSDSIEVIGFTGKVVVNGGSKLNLINILIIVVVILVILNIIWFVILRKRIMKR